MEKKLCCVVQMYVKCTECNEEWCNSCFLKDYYTRSHTHDDMQTKQGQWVRYFKCPITNRKTVIEGDTNLLTFSEYVKWAIQ